MEELQEQFLSKKELKKAGKEISKAQGKLDKQLGANWQKNEFLKHMISEGVLDDTWRQAIEQVII